MLTTAEKVMILLVKKTATCIRNILHTSKKNTAFKEGLEESLNNIIIVLIQQEVNKDNKMCDILQSVKEELNEIENEYLLPSTKTDIYEAAEPALLNLPVEIFLKICTFLDAEFISKTLSKVCTRFRDILEDAELWKIWIHERISGTFPVLPHLKVYNGEEPNWAELYIDMDREFKKWVNVKDRFRHIVVKGVHFASVDTVLLVRDGEICISGGRDRGIALWNVLSITPHDKSDNTTTFVDTKPEQMRHDAHTGWVWDLAADYPTNATMVYSASWDNTVKAWDLATGLTRVQTFRCGMSALSVVTSDNIVMAGLYSRKIMAFDIRVGPEPISQYKAHGGPVLALEHYKNKIASVSEDRTLAVWDRIAGKVLVSDVKMPTEKAYPVCLSWSHSALYVGDSKGSLHLIDPEELVYTRTHSVWPEQPQHMPSCKITGCHQSEGSLILCSDRGEVKFLYNSYPPQEYTTVKTSTLDITQLRYQNDVLVLGTCDSALEFWVPNERYDL